VKDSWKGAVATKFSLASVQLKKKRSVFQKGERNMATPHRLQPGKEGGLSWADLLQPPLESLAFGRTDCARGGELIAKGENMSSLAVYARRKLLRH